MTQFYGSVICAGLGCFFSSSHVGFYMHLQSDIGSTRSCLRERQLGCYVCALSGLPPYSRLAQVMPHGCYRVQNSSLQCTCTLQTSVGSRFANVLLTNATHFVRCSEYGRGLPRGVDPRSHEKLWGHYCNSLPHSLIIIRSKWSLTSTMVSFFKIKQKAKLYMWYYVGGKWALGNNHLHNTKITYAVTTNTNYINCCM